jgi:CHAT domain-containing protein
MAGGLGSAPPDTGWRFELLAGLARLHATTGDLAAAETALGELSRLKGSASGSGATPIVQASYEASLFRAEATVLQMRGRLPEAEDAWRRAIAAWKRLEGRGFDRDGWMVARQASDMVDLADCLLRRGRFLEAELEARRALREQVTGAGDVPAFSLHPVGILPLLSRILRAQGRYGDAATLALRAQQVYRRVGMSPAHAPPVVAPHLELGAIFAALRRWTDARREYDSARAALADQRLFRVLVEDDPAYLVTRARMDPPDAAVPALEAALARSIRAHGESHASSAQARALLALALARRGERSRALTEFRASADRLIDDGSDLTDEQTTRSERDQRVRDVLGDYVGVLSDSMGTPLIPDVAGAISESFRLADAARGRVVQRAVDAAALRSGANTPALAALIRREQDIAKQLNAMHGIIGNSYAPDESDEIRELRRRREALAVVRRDIKQQIARDFAGYARLTNPAPPTLEAVRAVLRPGEVLLTTLVTEHRTFVWAVPPSGSPTFVAVPVGEEALTTKIARVRRSLDMRVTTVGEIAPFDLETAHELYRLLLDPIRPTWENAATLVVVADGALGQLPLSLLPMKRVTLGPEGGALFSNYRAVPWLARRYAITTLPSASALVTLRRLPAPRSDRRPFVGFGDPYFSPEHVAAGSTATDDSTLCPRCPPAPPDASITRRAVVETPNPEVETSILEMLPRLPDTAAEIRGIAAAMNADPKRDVFLGVAANLKTVKSLDLTRYRVIAFATHGLVPGDLDGLTQPALALTAPGLAGIDGDGLLTMDEILGLRLDADWVVLSACNTANGAGAGGEAISGLGRAFFYAGARALLVTHWPVETRAARALTTDLFRRQTVETALPRGRALQATINWMIDHGEVTSRTGGAAFTFAHPFFWAPFELVGDGG